MRQASSKKRFFIRKNGIFSHIDGRQIEKSAWNLDNMCTHESNLPFERLKLELKLEHWLKTEKIEIWGGRVPITFESPNLKIEKFSGKPAAFRWKNTRNTSFRHRIQTVDIAQFRNNGIWKSHDFAKNWPKMASKWEKMNFLGLVTNKKVVDNN